MNLEPEKVKEERHADESECTSHKVFAELLERQAFLVIEEIPQIDRDSGANGDERKYTNVLGGYDAGHGDTSKEQPLPPFTPERNVAELVEADVAEKGASHGKYEGRIEENKTGLADVGVIYGLP